MENEESIENEQQGIEGHKRRGHGSRQRGPITFRRGRAIAFLEMMNLKRSTIKQQLSEPEFQSIQQMLVGELKAIDTIINEFIQLFEMNESETMQIANTKEAEGHNSTSSESLTDEKKGIDENEEN